MRRQRLAVPAAAAALVLCAGCFTMTNMKSGKVVSPGITLSAGGVLLGDQFAPMMVEARIGIMPRWDVGAKMEPLSYVMDTRLQLLNDERHSLDLAVEAGVGMLILPFTYGGIAVSKDMGSWNPYCLLRVVDMGGIDKSDIEGGSGSQNLLADIIMYLPNNVGAFLEVFLGVEIEISNAIALVPEVMVAPTLDVGGKPLTIFNVGLVFKFH